MLRNLERELKVQFEWRDADKDLPKEERNAPIDLARQPVGGMDDLLALESRSWRQDGAASDSPAAPRSEGRNAGRRRRRR